MVVEVNGLATSKRAVRLACCADLADAARALDAGTPSFERSALSVYCSVSLNQRQTYRTAVVNTDAATAAAAPNAVAPGHQQASKGGYARWEQAFLFTITDLDDALRVAVYTYDRF